MNNDLMLLSLIAGTAILAFKGVGNTNPLNIRYSPANDWVGQTGQRNGFATFSTRDYGVRAAIKLLNTYQSKGISTIRDIIYRWAPPSDNNPTEDYIDYVVNATGLPPTQRLYGPDLYKILVPMAMFESKTKLTSADIARASRLL